MADPNKPLSDRLKKSSTKKGPVNTKSPVIKQAQDSVLSSIKNYASMKKTTPSPSIPTRKQTFGTAPVIIGPSSILSDLGPGSSGSFNDPSMQSSLIGSGLSKRISSGSKLQAGYPSGWRPDMRTGSATEDSPDDSFNFGGFEDYLNSSGNMFASGNNIAARKADLEARRQAALAAISGGTDALANAVTTSRGDLDARYTQGIQEQAAAGTAAQDALAKTNANAASQNAQLYKNLGIAEGVDNSNNLNHEAASQGALAENAQAADTEQRSRQLTAYKQGTTNIDASRARGLELQASSARDYGTALADLLDQQTADSNSSNSQARSQYNNDRDFAYKEWVRQQENSRQDAQHAMDLAYGSQDSGSTPKLSDEDSILAQLQGYGVTPGKAAQWLDRGIRMKVNSQNFNDTFKSASGPSKAALFNYFKSIGLITS